MQVKSCRMRWTVRTETRGSSPRNYKQNRVTSPRARGGRGPWIIPVQAVWIIESEWIHSHSTVVAIHVWSNRRKDGEGVIWVADMKGIGTYSCPAFTNQVAVRAIFYYLSVYAALKTAFVTRMLLWRNWNIKSTIPPEAPPSISTLSFEMWANLNEKII